MQLMPETLRYEGALMFSRDIYFIYPFLVQDTSEAPTNSVDRTVWTFGQKATIELTQ